MRYIADSKGFIKQISFGADISCNGEDCIEYTGAVPSPYTSLESWYDTALRADQMCYWKIVDGNLTFDGSFINKRTDCPTIDWVVEQGEKAGWTYRIWASGVQECWISSTWEAFDLSARQQHSGFYYSLFVLGFPIPFASPPVVMVDGGPIEYISFLRVTRRFTDKINVWLLSLSDRTDPVDMPYQVYAKGKAITQASAVLGSNVLGLMRLGEGG